MLCLKIKRRLVRENLLILQHVISIMCLEMHLGLVGISRDKILWETTDLAICVIDNLSYHVPDNDSRFDSIFCYDDFHWQNRFSPTLK